VRVRSRGLTQKRDVTQTHVMARGGGVEDWEDIAPDIDIFLSSCSQGSGSVMMSAHKYILANSGSQYEEEIRQNWPLSCLEPPAAEMTIQAIPLASRYRRAMRAKVVMHQTMARL
jgi:hypothetical protein